MSWQLSHAPSRQGESPGDPSLIGFRGSRFSISRRGKLYLTDYQALGVTFDLNSSSYVRQVRDVLGHGWAGRLRIRANRDTYCSGNPSAIYIGKTYFADGEHFRGYHLGGGTPPPGGPPFPPPPKLWSGPHCHSQVGERWSIPQSGTRAGNYSSQHGGKIGVHTSFSGWSWSRTKHQRFIEEVRNMVPDGRNRTIRCYLTCYGYIVTPIRQRFWSPNYGMDDLDTSVVNVKINAPSAVKSSLHRVGLSEGDYEKTTLYFVCGHIDDLMDGHTPEPDLNDPNVGDVNQDRYAYG